MKRRLLVLLILALTASTSARAAIAHAPTPFQQCVVAQRADLPPGADALAHMDKVLLICFDTVADEQRLKVIAVNERIYENQLWQNNALLVLVTAITLSGVVLAALQLLGSYRLAQTGRATFGDSGEVDLQPSHVAVRSSIVGVVILAISLAFFAIFITYVYQIKPYATLTSAPAAAADAKSEDAPPKDLPEIKP